MTDANALNVMMDAIMLATYSAVTHWHAFLAVLLSALIIGWACCWLDERDTKKRRARESLGAREVALRWANGASRLWVHQHSRGLRSEQLTPRDATDAWRRGGNTGVRPDWWDKANGRSR